MSVAPGEISPGCRGMRPFLLSTNAFGRLVHKHLLRSDRSAGFRCAAQRPSSDSSRGWLASDGPTPPAPPPPPQQAAAAAAAAARARRQRQGTMLLSQSPSDAVRKARRGRGTEILEQFASEPSAPQHPAGGAQPAASASASRSASRGRGRSARTTSAPTDQDPATPPAAGAAPAEGVACEGDAEFQDAGVARLRRGMPHVMAAALEPPSCIHEEAPSAASPPPALHSNPSGNERLGGFWGAATGAPAAMGPHVAGRRTTPVVPHAQDGTRLRSMRYSSSTDSEVLGLEDEGVFEAAGMPGQVMGGTGEGADWQWQQQLAQRQQHQQGAMQPQAAMWQQQQQPPPLQCQQQSHLQQIQQQQQQQQQQQLQSWPQPSHQQSSQPLLGAAPSPTWWQGAAPPAVLPPSHPATTPHEWQQRAVSSSSSSGSSSGGQTTFDQGSQHAPPSSSSTQRRKSQRTFSFENDVLAELTDLLLDRGIQIDSPCFESSHRLICPECEGGRSSEKSLSVTLMREGCAVWNCFRATCGWSGHVKASGSCLEATAGGTARGGISHSDGDAGGGTVAAGASRGAGGHDGVLGLEGGASVGEAGALGVSARPGRPPAQLPNTSRLRPVWDSPQLLKWFTEERGISLDTLRRQQRHVAVERRYVAGSGEQDAVAFLYSKGAVVVNIKYRALPKVWSQTKGGEQIFYGLEDIEGQEEIIIVEGEMDKLAFAEAGIHNVVSVPSGAVAPKRISHAPQPSPPPAPPSSPSSPAAAAGMAAAGTAAADAPGSSKVESGRGRGDAKFAFLRRAAPLLAGVKRVVLATDDDAPGRALAEELARRLGRGRCRLLRWPEGCKDANELLLRMRGEGAGAGGLRAYLHKAVRPMPEEGLV